MVGTGDVGRVTVKDRGTAESAPSTKSRSTSEISGRSVVVRNGDPRVDPKSWPKSRAGLGGPAREELEVEVDGNWKRAGRETFREYRREPLLRENGGGVTGRTWDGETSI